MKKLFLFLALMMCSATIVAEENQSQRMFSKMRKQVKKSLPVKDNTQLLAGNVLGAPLPGSTGSRSLPTEIYRIYSNGKKVKELLQYDAIGNVISLAEYNEFDSSWTLDGFGNPITSPWQLLSTTTYSYTTLPNGAMRITEMLKEAFPERVADLSFGSIIKGYHEQTLYTASYDTKGMQLWNQTENRLDNENSWTDWELVDRQEPVIVKGVRTGLRNYTSLTQQWTPDPHYTFDPQGRIARYYNEAINYAQEYTWSPEGKLVGMREIDRDYISKFTNIVAVANEEYINTYDLEPLDSHLNDYPSNIYWNAVPKDLSLKDFLYNADVVEMDMEDGISYTMKSTINKDKTEMKTGYYMDKILMYEEVKTVGELGNITFNIKYYDERGNVEYDESMGIEYNKHGDIVRYFGPDGDEILYNRNYSPDETRLTRTEVIYNREYFYTETYEDWIWIISGVSDITADGIKIYPNPTTDKVYVELPDSRIPLINIYNLQGTQLLKMQSNEVDLSAFNNGIYLLQIDGVMQKVIKK